VCMSLKESEQSINLKESKCIFDHYHCHRRRFADFNNTREACRVAERRRAKGTEILDSEGIEAEGVGKREGSFPPQPTTDLGEHFK